MDTGLGVDFAVLDSCIANINNIYTDGGSTYIMQQTLSNMKSELSTSKGDVVDTLKEQAQILKDIVNAVYGLMGQTSTALQTARSIYRQIDTSMSDAMGEN